MKEIPKTRTSLTVLVMEKGDRVQVQDGKEGYIEMTIEGGELRLRCFPRTLLIHPRMANEVIITMKPFDAEVYK